MTTNKHRLTVNLTSWTQPSVYLTDSKALISDGWEAWSRCNSIKTSESPRPMIRAAHRHRWPPRR